MWLKDNTTATEGFDQQGMNLTNNTLDFYSLTNLPSWKNMNYITTSLDPNINTQRTPDSYMRLYGTINFSRWDISSDEKTALLVRAIKGLTVDSPDYTLILPEGLDLDSLAKLEFKALPDTTPWSEVFTKINNSALTDAAELFMNRNFVDDGVDLVLNAPSLVNCTSMFKGSNIPRITSIDLTTNCILDSMFEECRGLQADCLIPMTTASCQRMFYNCSNIVTTSNNYERYYGHYFKTLGMYHGVGATSYTYPDEMTVTKFPQFNQKASFGTYSGYISVFHGISTSGAGVSYPLVSQSQGTENISGKFTCLQLNGMNGIDLPSNGAYVSTSTTLVIPYIIDGKDERDTIKTLKFFNKKYFQDAINKFCGASKINNLLDLSRTSSDITTVDFNNYRKLTSASNAFKSNRVITTVNMPDTYNLENGNNMFYDCAELTTFTIPSLQKLKDGSYMFYDCRKLLFDTIPVTEGFPELTNAYMMFQNCKKLTTIDLKNTSKLVNANYMLNGCFRLTEIKNLNHCTALEEIDYAFFDTHITSIDLSGLSKLRLMQYAFTNCTNLTTVTGLNDLANCTSIYAAFKGCTALTTLNNGQEVLLPKVTNANEAFNGCTALRQVKLNLPSITNLSSNANGIFTGCTLTKATLKATSCTNASNVFSGMSSLQELDFNPGDNCTTYNNTLKGCTGLTKLKINIQGYDSDTQDRENANHGTSDKDYTLFGYCSALTDIDFYGEIRHAISFKYNPLLNSNSINNIIRALYDCSQGERGYSILLPTGLSITTQQTDAITAKGWTIVWA